MIVPQEPGLYEAFWSAIGEPAPHDWVERPAMQLSGLLLQHTPAGSGPGSIPVHDLTKVSAPSDLPRRLFMGYRDDASFVRSREGYSVSYQLDGEHVLDLTVEGTLLRWKQRWRRIPGPGGACSARQIMNMVRHVPVASAWQDLLESELAQTGNFVWLRPATEGVHMTFLPDGILVVVAFPVHADALPKLPDFYASLASRWDPRGLAPAAYSFHVPLPVWHHVPEYPPGHPRYSVRGQLNELYRAELGLPQGLPDDCNDEPDGLITYLAGREGFLHVALLALRDLLPFARELVRAGLVALCRYEDRPEIDGPAGPLWDRSIAPFRAVATTAGVASETLRFSSEDGEFECLYPSPSQLISHLVRADAYHGITVEDTRRIANAVAEAARAIRNNPVTRLV